MSQKTLRDYQAADIVKISNLLKMPGKNRGIVQYATGGGKTITAIELIKKCFPADQKRTLFIAPSVELVLQPYRVFQEQYPEVKGMFKAGFRKVKGLGMLMADNPNNDPSARVIVGSIPTLIERSEEPADPSLMWLNEKGKKLARKHWTPDHRKAYDAYKEQYQLWLDQRDVNNAPIKREDIEVLPDGGVKKSPKSKRSFLVSYRMDEILRHGLIDALVYDECHHAAGDGSLVLIQRLDQLYAALGEKRMAVIGFTATPVRADNRSLGAIFSDIYARRGYPWMQENGYLVPIKDPPIRATVLVDVGSQDAKRVKQVINWAQQIVEAWKEKGEDRPTIAYVGPMGDIGAIEASKVLREAFVEAGVAAAHIDGQMCVDVNGDELDKETGRRKIFEAYQKGLIKVLCNFGVLIEGVDLPITSCILLARSANPVTLTQMIGRMLRLYPGKDDALLIDFTGERLEVVTAGSLMGYKVDPLTNQYVKDLEKEEEETDSLDEYSEDIRALLPQGMFQGKGRVYEAGKIIASSKSDWYSTSFTTMLLTLPVDDEDNSLLITYPNLGKLALSEAYLREIEYALEGQTPEWDLSEREQKRMEKYAELKETDPDKLSRLRSLAEWVKTFYGEFCLWHIAKDEVVKKTYIGHFETLDEAENFASQYAYMKEPKGGWIQKKRSAWKKKPLSEYPKLENYLGNVIIPQAVKQGVIPDKDVFQLDSMKAGEASNLVSHLKTIRVANTVIQLAENFINKLSTA